VVSATKLSIDYSTFFDIQFFGNGKRRASRSITVSLCGPQVVFPARVNGKSINQPFSTHPRVVSPANACVSRARGLERELKRIGATHEEA